MEIIISEENKLYKKACKLKLKKYRDLCGEYLIEGLRGVVDTPDEYIKIIFVLNGSVDCRLNKEKLVYLSDKLMKNLSMTDSSSGVIAIASKALQSDFVSDYVLYLDRIRDPGNMGTIIRTAVAAGYEIVCDDCVDVYNSKVVRSCVSALSKARLHIGNFIDILAEKGYNIIGAALGGSNVFESAKQKKLCLVIGNEANGIRNEILDKCNSICTIPMNDMESLNASVSAGILMYYYKF